MPRGGELRITLGIVDIDSEARKLTLPGSLPSGRYACITIEDTGVGMTAEELARAFERGYSTRGIDRGYGLSLIVEMLEGLGGGISASSSPGKGSRFEVLLSLDEGRPFLRGRW